MFMACLSAATGQGTWSKIDVPTDHFLRSVFFTDSLYGWAVGNGGVIIHTQDGGQNWVHQDSGAENDIVDVVFLNRNYGWASSFNYTVSPYGTILLKTYNGGQDWISEPYPEVNLFMNCILMLDSMNMWMGGSPHAIVNSRDAGETWQQATVDTSILAFFPVLSIRFQDENIGYACGGMFEIAGVIWRTTDGGETWTAIDPIYAPADEVYELHLYDSLNVIGAGGDPDFGYGVAFIRTHNGGLTWEYEELGLQGNSYDLDFRNELEAWSPLGPKKKLIYSLDGGNTWTEIDTPEQTAIFDMMFPDSLHGFSCGMDGAMLKYKPLHVSVPEIPGDDDAGFVLHQNFPNPFRCKTRFEFRIPDPGSQRDFSLQSQNNTCHTVKLYAFDLTGRQVSTIIDQPFPPGVHQVELDGSGLPPGIYLYRFMVEDTDGQPEYIMTRKMMILP